MLRTRKIWKEETQAVISAYFWAVGRESMATMTLRNYSVLQKGRLHLFCLVWDQDVSTHPRFENMLC